MPFQVNGQPVTTKPSRLVHVAGCDGAFVVTAGAAFVTVMSSADASVTYAAPASPRITAAETPNFFNMSRARTESRVLLYAKPCEPSRPPIVQILLLLLQSLTTPVAERPPHRPLLNAS